MPQQLARLAANALLAVHVLYVAFVVVGFALTVVGGLKGWSWVRSFRFRLAHLVSIGIVVLEVVAKLDCPLTIWEQEWRKKAGDTLYETDFITHWLRQAVPMEIPPWVFAVVYIGFGAAVAATWWRWPPNRPHWRPSRGRRKSP